MEGNFPKNLSIHASDPKSIIPLLELGTSTYLVDDTFQVGPIIESQDSDIESYGIAGRIWEAAYALIIYLNSPPNVEFDPPCSLFDSRTGAVIELGAGTGFLGLAMARLFSSKICDGSSKTIILTDLPDVCPLLDRNYIQKMPNGLPNVKLFIEPLPWGIIHFVNNLADKISNNSIKSTPLLSHIICSDLVYFPELSAPLLRTLIHLTSPPFSTGNQPVEIIMSYMLRTLPKEMPFWYAFGAWFDFIPVVYRQKEKSWKRFGEGEKDTCFIFIATRKPETLTWPIPDGNDLLKKGNDTFENLLLMNMPVDDN